MNRKRSLAALLTLMTAPALFAGTSADAAAKERLNATYAKLPLQFESNEGQADSRVKYLVRGQGYTLLLARDQAVLALHGLNALRMRLLGDANPNPTLVPLDQLPGQVNYFNSNDHKNWHTGIGTWKSVRYQNVYPGIDLVFWGNQQHLEFDFIAAAGADPSRIRFHIDGADTSLNAGGDVSLKTGDETITLRKPVLYQTVNGGRTPVDGHFTISKSGDIAFACGRFDRSRALVIDPVLDYASYLGGTGDNVITGVASNAAGEAFVTGWTDALIASTGSYFPTTPGVVGPSQRGCSGSSCNVVAAQDAFVSRISADGTHLIYSTYLGGSAQDQARAITVDAGNNAYITGFTYSTDFPLVNPYQSLCGPAWTMQQPVYSGEPFNLEFANCGSTNGAPDVFITKLNASGTQLLYSTYFGGTANENPNGIALDAQGNIVIAGSTSSVDLPLHYYPNPNYGYVPFPTTVTAYQDAVHATLGDQSYFLAFVSKFSPDGQRLLYSTTFGATSGNTVAQGTSSMAIGTGGFVAIGGTATSPGMPTKNAIQSSCGAIPNQSACYQTGFLAAFDTTLSGAGSLLFATYLGGSVPLAASTNVNGVAVDAQNNVFATGATQAHDFPATPGTLFPGCTTSDTTRLCHDAFVVKTNSSGALRWATNYGNGVGACPQVTGYAIAVDPKDNVYFTGNLGGCGLIAQTSVNPLQNVNGNNAFISVLSADGSKVLFGSGYGGTGTEIPYAITLDPGSNIYIGGQTTSTNLPGVANSFQPTFAGGPENGFIAKVSSIYLASSTGLQVSPSPASIGQTVTLTATVKGQNGQPVPTGAVTFSNGSTVLGSGNLSGGGVATYSTSALPAWTNQISAAYAGDALYLSSTSPSVALTVAGSGAPPFGSFDSPANNAAVSGAVAVTGWALSAAGITKVDLWREPNPGEAAGPGGLVYVGDAALVTGARPDVQQAYPSYPGNAQAGWGLQLLTDELPSNTVVGVGNGTFKLHAIAHAADGQSLDLGTRTITVNNAGAVQPFGTLDTPAQGGTASGSAYVNFGWAVTPVPTSVIPKDGSTIGVYIDNKLVGHPVYNQYRADIATLFPGLQNSGGAVGYFVIDTTKLANGVHTIAWVVTDSAGRATGIGSRYFSVVN